MTDDEIQLLEDLLELESGLTAWEIDFIDSLDKQRQRTLTEKQEECLHRIAQKTELEQ